MRVLIYSHAFAPKIGGLETLVMSLAKGLSKQGTPTSEAAHVTVVTPTPRGNFDDSSLPFFVLRQPSLLQLLRLVRSAEVIHLSGPAFIPLLLGVLLRKRVVVEHSTYQGVCPNGLLLDERTKKACPGHFIEKRYAECLRCNASNVSSSKSLAMLMFTFPRRWMCGKVARNIVPTAHVGHRLGLARTEVLYHGVPPPQSSSAAMAIASPTTFGYLGRLVSEKGLSLLVEAARRLHADGYIFRLKFIGDGPERSRLTAAIDSLGLHANVTFTGFLQGADLDSALADVTAIVMPSIMEEMAGLSAIEQMMRGRLVIATDIGGLGEVVDSVGLKFPVGDIDSLTACMKRVIDDPALANDLGKQAGERARALFSSDGMVAAHESVYRRVSDNRNESSRRQS